MDSVGSPVVIALTGLPGTGKSTLGSLLYPRLPDTFGYVDLDTVTRPLLEAALRVSGLTPDLADASGILRRLRDAQYGCLLDHVRELLSFGRNVLYVAPMTHEFEDRASFHRFLEGLGRARFLLVRTNAAPATVRERLAQRRDLLDPLRLARWDLDRRRYEHPSPLPVSGLEIDSTATAPAILADRVARWLEIEIRRSAAAMNDEEATG